MADNVGIISLLFFSILIAIQSDLSLVDLNICKITHLGTEYLGNLSVTMSNRTCQYWNSETSKKLQKFEDKDFSDGFEVLAENHCRNPDKNANGPWCYAVFKKKIKNESCPVPLCKSFACRVTGPGMEYAGTIKRSSSGKQCLNWEDKIKRKGKHKKPLLEDKFFPDGSVTGAGSNCRNPDGSVAGPWCYVEKEDTESHGKELCDVPFCDDLGTIMYSEGSIADGYFFYTEINRSQSFNISFRLWDPADWQGSQVNLLLSVYDIAATKEDLESWFSSVEIIFSNAGSGISSREGCTLTKTPWILSGAKWTDLGITWTFTENHSILVQVFRGPKLNPILLGEILVNGTIFELECFQFFSLTGSPTLWSIKSSDEECFVHTASRVNFTRYWLIRKKTLSRDIDIFVRANREAVIMLRSAPMISTNQVQITIKDKDKIKVFTNSSRQIAETSWPNNLDFWTWEHFKIALTKDKLQVYWVRRRCTELMIEATHANIENVMWIAFASPFVSYWTIYCDPRGVKDPPYASPPECVSERSDDFFGTLSVTKSGQHCIPWSDERIPNQYRDENLFERYGGKQYCRNFCRNLNNDNEGAFCVVKDIDEDSSFRKEYCYPRSCSLGDCKLAGTGNDYTGRLNKTRSKRDCMTWSAVKNDLIDVKNFPDPSLEDAENFCRNPSKSVSGSWCYTNDPRVPKDLCYIKDCDKPLECAILMSGHAEGNLMFILPDWRKSGLTFWLKAWNPDFYEGLVISIVSADLSREYKLLIGDEDNEKLKLIFKCGDFETVIRRKTLPHLVPTGKWGGYWLRISKPGKIELGYEGEANSFFEWMSAIEELTFEPMFINMGTIKGHWIGINFQCTECLVEQISNEDSNKRYPINIWRDETVTSNLVLNLRGTGTAYVTLMWSEDFQKYFEIQIYSNCSYIYIVTYQEGNPETLAVFPATSPMLINEWSEYVISFTEDSLTVHKDNAHVFEWPSSFPLLFYWFSVSAAGGSVVWSANCPAADVDGEPRDGNWGKWGPWTCSVTCGGGLGRMERECDDPPPNVFGRECKGSSVYEGICNDFPCGEISPGTYNLIRHYLSSQHKSLEVNAGEKVILNCNIRAVGLITAEASKVNITWSHNGSPISRVKSHMDENYSLVISRAQEKHNGIYFCVAYQDPYSVLPKVVLEVVSLVVVKDKPNKKIRKGRSLNLKCNGLALSYVYADLTQRWELNGEVWKDYGLGTLQMYAVDKLEKVSDFHAGIWKCVVIQEDLKFNWTTNWLHLKVKSDPNFWSYLKEDMATAPLFGKLGSERNVMILFFTIIGILVIIIIWITSCLVKCLRK